jgi:single-strand DNA-binding protein
MLRASLIGNLGSDPEVRFTQKGDELVTVQVAVNRRKRAPDSDEWTESTAWFRVRCSGWRADLAKKLSKGTRVYVCGRLEFNEWIRRDGTLGITYEIWADEVHGMGGSRTDNGGEAQPRQVRAPELVPQTVTAAVDDDELPF